jgi:transposase
MSDKKSRSKTYTSEFIQGAIQLVRKEHRKVSQVAKSLGIAPSTLSSWLRRYPASGSVQEQRDQGAEIRTLQEENRQLKMENSILKKAAAYFAKEVL